jgi:hypothetical protein
MQLKTPLALIAIVGLQTVTPSQSPLLSMPGGSQISPTGAALNFTLSGQPGAPFAIFVDVDGGPVDVFGERFYLGFSSSLTAVRTDLVPPGGVAVHATSLPAFPGLSGLVVYAQAVALDPTASNGLFRASNGASSACYGGNATILETFDSPLPAGYTGTFVQDVTGHVRGGPITTRIVNTVDPQGVPFNAPIASPLQPFGSRQQIVYRAINLGATGEPELITGVRWRSLLSPQADNFPQFTMRIGHTDVVPNYTIDPWSALPAFPNSGLSTTFSDNELLGAPPSVVYTGAYPINPAQALPGNYMPYPMSSTFAYDGQSSLLIDFRVPQSTALGVNGMAVNLMVQSSALPGTRVVAAGNATQPVAPNQVATGVADNAMPDFQIELARTMTFVASPWLDSLVAAPDYDTAIVAKSLPAGTSVQVQYRGSSSASGTNPTAWSSSQDVADGKRYLQYRITFQANHLTGERPLVDTLLVPIL